ncbi:hypothetical protein KPY62_07870 [Psychrobacter sp. TAE2020]|uniref:hypothetical protein n=1 Tax=Psychrobacter sp. TAE2020 TaxID=2846762 RepID=UPI001C128537|nr:hypothetical protein [Psychrobacter sp. TAE2020]MBU5617005.1 hypothetical protein [Psychrobacter sp. TAE2020]
MIFKLSTLLTAMLTGTLLLTSCQQQSASVIDDKDSQNSEQLDAEDNKKAVQSDSTKARIEQFQPLYVAEVLSLQRRLQAEYDAFEAADTSVDETSLLNTDIAITDPLATDDQTPTASKNEPVIPLALDSKAGNDPKTIKTDTSANTEINTSTEIGERDLEVLKLISLEPQQPKILTEAQIIKRYQQAMKALYQPVTTELNAQEIDTLINISTLLAQLFEHEEIAQRVNVKSPALARLIVQYQVGKQIEAQQVLDMQQMKVTQQQEFEGLMLKFNETIKGYDEQIAKYEQTLKDFK